MASNLKKRIDRISDKASPKRFLTIEDIIFRVRCEDKADLTGEDRQRLEETENLLVHPELEKRLNRLLTKREQSETNAGNPR
ncbi:MAG: hypothetical protein HGJ94_21805 [Desulfosarcina sp.]|nr:hypothetical protein [Desulfosarcina sp.]MBC2742611.1 hypothetical protein [Desulfosarcina sp.]MBC2765521.1 hypothetical protein [Desulfosarcina sp.]